jgi:NAD(P)-dependent dehydrogenase (short-subunit alcohol dehydrogenase family)
MSKPIVIITGASRGIGAAVAKLAASAGYDVCVNYRTRANEAHALVTELTRAGGARAIAVQADVAVEADVVRLFESVDRELGPPVALVNNAGVLQRQMRVDEMTADRITQVFAANVLGAFLCCREAIRRMSTRHGGRGGAIVNVSSMASRLGSPNEYVDYAASKGALDTLTLGLAKEVAGEKIRVNAVRPGLIHTEMHAIGGEPDRIERLKSSVPLQRGGQPEEVAHAVLWLLSEQASFTTGAFIDVSGGK